ncbi:MAG: trimeric intracellular cation channel family protein [Bacteroidota bacterium]
MDIIYALDLIGTLVFAISGTLTAVARKFDLFGAAVIGFVTAVGGGTIRDILLGSHPVGWMLDLNYLSVIGVAVVLSYLFQSRILRLRRTMFLFDTIGIGLFTILGVQKTLGFGLSPVIAVMMGTVSAVFGGVLRDTLSNEVPLIFREEIYATACVAGGILFLLLRRTPLTEPSIIALTICFIIVLRIVAVKRKWTLNFSESGEA